MSEASSRAPYGMRRDAVAADHRGRGVDGVHHVVERLGQRVDVLAVDRGDEGAVQPLDDLVGQRVAGLLDLLDLDAHLPRRRVGGQHLLEQRGARDDAVGQGDEIGVELLFLGDQAKRGHGHSSVRARVPGRAPGVCHRFRYTNVTNVSRRAARQFTRN